METEMSNVRVSTAAFQAAHGKAPRGTGHWAFFFGFNSREVVQEPFFVKGEQTFSEAKREAVAEAKSRGFTFVEVGS
jgi:hypothetical protein